MNADDAWQEFKKAVVSERAVKKASVSEKLDVISAQLVQNQAKMDELDGKIDSISAPSDDGGMGAGAPPAPGGMPGGGLAALLGGMGGGAPPGGEEQGGDQQEGGGQGVPPMAGAAGPGKEAFQASATKKKLRPRSSIAKDSFVQSAIGMTSGDEKIDALVDQLLTETKGKDKYSKLEEELSALRNQSKPSDKKIRPIAKKTKREYLEEMREEEKKKKAEKEQKKEENKWNKILFGRNPEDQVGPKMYLGHFLNLARIAKCFTLEEAKKIYEEEVKKAYDTEYDPNVIVPMLSNLFDTWMGENGWGKYIEADYAAYLKWQKAHPNEKPYTYKSTKQGSVAIRNPDVPGLTPSEIIAFMQSVKTPLNKLYMSKIGSPRIGTFTKDEWDFLIGAAKINHPALASVYQIARPHLRYLSKNSKHAIDVKDYDQAKDIISVISRQFFPVLEKIQEMDKYHLLESMEGYEVLGELKDSEGNPLPIDEKIEAQIRNGAANIVNASRTLRKINADADSFAQAHIFDIFPIIQENREEINEFEDRSLVDRLIDEMYGVGTAESILTQFYQSLNGVRYSIPKLAGADNNSTLTELCFHINSLNSDTKKIRVDPDKISSLWSLLKDSAKDIVYQRTKGMYNEIIAFADNEEYIKNIQRHLNIGDRSTLNRLIREAQSEGESAKDVPRWVSYLYSKIHTDPTTYGQLVTSWDGQTYSIDEDNSQRAKQNLSSSYGPVDEETREALIHIMEMVSTSRAGGELLVPGSGVNIGSVLKALVGSADMDPKKAYEKYTNKVKNSAAKHLAKTTRKLYAQAAAEAYANSEPKDPTLLDGFTVNDYFDVNGIRHHKKIWNLPSREEYYAIPEPFRPTVDKVLKKNHLTPEKLWTKDNKIEAMIKANIKDRGERRQDRDLHRDLWTVEWRRSGNKRGLIPEIFDSMLKECDGTMVGAQKIPKNIPDFIESFRKVASDYAGYDIGLPVKPLSEEDIIEYADGSELCEKNLKKALSTYNEYAFKSLYWFMQTEELGPNDALLIERGRKYDTTEMPTKSLKRASQQIARIFYDTSREDTLNKIVLRNGTTGPNNYFADRLKQGLELGKMEEQAIAHALLDTVIAYSRIREMTDEVANYYSDKLRTPPSDISKDDLATATALIQAKKLPKQITQITQYLHDKYIRDNQLPKSTPMSPVALIYGISAYNALQNTNWVETHKPYISKIRSDRKFLYAASHIDVDLPYGSRGYRNRELVDKLQSKYLSKLVEVCELEDHAQILVNSLDYAGDNDREPLLQDFYNTLESIRPKYQALQKLSNTILKATGEPKLMRWLEGSPLIECAKQTLDSTSLDKWIDRICDESINRQYYPDPNRDHLNKPLPGHLSELLKNIKFNDQDHAGSGIFMVRTDENWVPGQTFVDNYLENHDKRLWDTIKTNRDQYYFANYGCTHREYLEATDPEAYQRLMNSRKTRSKLKEFERKQKAAAKKIFRARKKDPDYDPLDSTSGVTREQIRECLPVLYPTAFGLDYATLSAIEAEYGQEGVKQHRLNVCKAISLTADYIAQYPDMYNKFGPVYKVLFKKPGAWFSDIPLKMTTEGWEVTPLLDWNKDCPGPTRAYNRLNTILYSGNRSKKAKEALEHIQGMYRKERKDGRTLYHMPSPFCVVDGVRGKYVEDFRYNPLAGEYLYRRGEANHRTSKWFGDKKILLERKKPEFDEDESVKYTYVEPRVFPIVPVCVMNRLGSIGDFTRETDLDKYMAFVEDYPTRRDDPHNSVRNKEYLASLIAAGVILYTDKKKLKDNPRMKRQFDYCEELFKGKDGSRIDSAKDISPRWQEGDGIFDNDPKYFAGTKIQGKAITRGRLLINDKSDNDSKNSSEEPETEKKEPEIKKIDPAKTEGSFKAIGEAILNEIDQAQLPEEGSPKKKSKFEQMKKLAMDLCKLGGAETPKEADTPPESPKTEGAGENKVKTPTETPPVDTPPETPPVDTPPETPPVDTPPETPPVDTPPETPPVDTPPETPKTEGAGENNDDKTKPFKESVEHFNQVFATTIMKSSKERLTQRGRRYGQGVTKP